MASRPALPELTDQPVTELPGSFAATAASGNHEPLEWWRAFNDPALDEVVGAVLESNFDLAESVARLQQASVRARLAEAPLLPIVRAGAGVDSFDVPINAGIGAQLGELGLDEAFGGADGGFTLPERIGLTTYSLYADFAYELDFWGRIRHASLAAGADLGASESDAHAARIGVLTETDVRAAALRLEAAAHDIEARRAELMPSLSLSGAVGLQTTDVGGLFNVQQWFGNLVSNLLAPVFDGDRLAGNVALAHARFNELAAAYGRTVVTAVNEVESALAGLRSENLRHALLSARREEARESLALRSQRYQSGVGGYADFLDALRTRLTVESALSDSARSLALARLAVHRALGGAWTRPQTAPAPLMANSNPEE